jgi:endonuclease/exonuclease/phosphatase family metal-dependent hydrolase
LLATAGRFSTTGWVFCSFRTEIPCIFGGFSVKSRQLWRNLPQQSAQTSAAKIRSVRGLVSMAATAAIAAQPVERLRLVTYNVRRFTAEDGTSTVAEVAAALRALGPSFVCLNEVDLDKRPGALETVARELGGFHIEFFGHVKGKDGFDKYGNALLSRYPAVRSERTHLDGGFESQHNGQPYRIHRGLLAVDFAVPLPAASGGTLPLTVAATHLDHISEPERRTQLAHVVRALGEPEQQQPGGGGGVIVLMGDLNAMTRSDYSAEEWAAHEKRNAGAGWEPPATGERD